MAAYVKGEGLREGYYLVFSEQHDDDDVLYEEDDIGGVKIFTYVVRTRFDTPSKP